MFLTRLIRNSQKIECILPEAITTKQKIICSTVGMTAFAGTCYIGYKTFPPLFDSICDRVNTDFELICKKLKKREIKKRTLMIERENKLREEGKLEDEKRKINIKNT